MACYTRHFDDFKKDNGYDDNVSFDEEIVSEVMRIIGTNYTKKGLSKIKHEICDACGLNDKKCSEIIEHMIKQKLIEITYNQFTDKSGMLRKYQIYVIV